MRFANQSKNVGHLVFQQSMAYKLQLLMAMIAQGLESMCNRNKLISDGLRPFIGTFTGSYPAYTAFTL